MIANHLWQSTVFTLAVMLLAFALRNKRAAVRHRLWLIASIKFLVPFALFTAIGSQLHWEKASTTVAAPVSTAIVRLSEPFAPAEPFVFSAVGSRAAAAPTDYVTPLLAIWIAGVLASLGLWFRHWFRFHNAAKRATRLDVDFPIPVLSCKEAVEPGVFGVFRPALLLPGGIEDRLSAEHLKAVLAHELSHVHRRDNFTAAIHMVVESLFWFHPLVWWIRARLIEEQERACDEDVLRQGSDPQIYAESILKICQFCVASPLLVAGIGGANLKQRITEIMRHRAGQRLGWFGVTILLVASTVSVALPVTVGVLQQKREQFEVVSIRLTDPGAPPMPGVRGGNNGPCTANPAQISPNRITISNATLYNLIVMAYGKGNCMRWSKYGLVSGGPAWVREQKFTIQATMPESTPKYSMAQLREGQAPHLEAMLRSMLEDRFQLKFHNTTKEIPLYELTPAKDGMRMNWDGQASTEGGRLMKNGDCDDIDLSVAMQNGIQMTKPFCGQRMLTFAGSPPQSWLLTMTGATSTQLAEMLEISMDRPIVDKSGISGKLNLRITFAFDGITPAPDGPPMTIEPDPNVPSLFATLQEKLGLKLAATKGPIDVLVIDSAQRPTN